MDLPQKRIVERTCTPTYKSVPIFKKILISKEFRNKPSARVKPIRDIFHNLHTPKRRSFEQTVNLCACKDVSTLNHCIVANEHVLHPDHASVEFRHLRRQTNIPKYQATI